MTADDVFGLFLRDYFLLSFTAALGAVQIGAAAGGLRGLMVLPWRRVTYWAGALLILAGALNFFLSPMWSDGPWASKFGHLPPGGVPGRTAEWGRASADDFAQARIINDIDGGLSGTDQAGVFAGGTLLAIAVSLAAGSLRRVSGEAVRADPATGIEMLKTGRYLASLRASLRYWRTAAAAEIRRQWLSPVHRWGLRDLYLRWRAR